MLTFLLHICGLASMFSPLAGLFSPAPIINQDWGLHFHHLKSIEEFWRQDKMLWGYNPFFMAGYPSNTIQDLSIKFFELSSLALAHFGLSTVQWFKLCAFLANAAVPFLMYFSARNFFPNDEDSKRLTACAAALLGTAYWWNSLPREMFFYGMLGFPVASYLSVYGTSLIYRLTLHRPAFGWVHINWLLFAVAILPVHVQAVLIFLPPLIALWIMQREQISPQLLAWGIAPWIVSLLVNSIWLMAAFDHRADDISVSLVEQLALFSSTDPFTFVFDYFGRRSYWSFRMSLLEKSFRVALLVLGALGTWKLLRSEHRVLGIVLLVASSALFVLTYFASLIPSFRALQPLRFKVPLDLFLSIAAAYSVRQWLTHSLRPWPRLVPVLLTVSGITFLFNLAQTETSAELRLRTGMTPETTSIVEWVRHQAPKEARVLFEESGDETGFVYDGVYLSSLLPYLTDRQIIGGPVNLYNDRHHFAEFHSAKLFKKDIAAFSDQSLSDHLRLYNIGAVVAFHPTSVRRFLASPHLLELHHRVGRVHLFKVNQPLSWLLDGVGRVNADLNRIEVSNTNGDNVILKFHWHPRLIASPEVKIDPLKLYNDPIPFIQVLKPPDAFTLRIGR